VQDCVLLEGCWVGRYARVRRAVVGAGAVVPDGAEIGYGVTPPWGLERPSGLTLVADRDTRLAVASQREHDSSALGA
jgi:ADP-glucose pyrophosphorylase